MKNSKAAAAFRNEVGMENETKKRLVKPGMDTPLGVSFSHGMFNFAVSIPGSSSCNLVLYKKGETAPAEVIPMETSALGVFSVAVCIPEKNGKTDYEYLYQTENSFVCDPYAKRITGREVFGEEPEYIRAAVSVLPQTQAVQHKRHTLSELVLYKLHVRGFTLGKSSGVRKKGTYAGIIEKIPYLKELGINVVLLMPVTEFDELEAEHTANKGTVIGIPARTYMGQEKKNERQKKGQNAQKNVDNASKKINYWGYTSSAYYFAPKASYAAEPEKADLEFKRMTDMLHEAGIDVYLEMMFDEKVSQSFMLDCLRHWVRAYGIDGFHICEQQLPVSLVAGDVYLAATAFMVSEVPEWLKEKYPDRLLEYRENFCMEMRRYLKGDEGMVSTLTHYMKNRRCNAARIHYIADHNGFTLADLYSYDVRHNEANGENGRDGSDYNLSWNCGEEGPTRSKKVQTLRLRMMKNALALTVLSQGTPMLLAGDEFGRTKQGNNNAYCQDNEVSWLDWSLARRNCELTEFVQKLLKLRKEHPLFTMERELRETDFIGCGWPAISVHGVSPWQLDMSSYNRLAAYLYCGSYVRRTDHTMEDSFYMIFNMHWEKHEFRLPKLDGFYWNMVFDTGADKYANQEGEVSTEHLELSPRSVVLLKTVPVEKRKNEKRH